MNKLILILCFLAAFMAGCSDNQKDAFEPIYNTNTYETEEKQEENIVTEVPEATADPGEDELSNFKGIVSEVKSSAGNDLSINTKLCAYTCLVCPDVENGIIYYVNYGKDDYIYQLKDGKSSLVLDRKTRFIQLWEGELYFFGLNNDEETYSNIYKYNLKDKKVDLLIEEANPCWMYINPDGFYYARYNIEQGYTREGYRLPFGSTSPEPYEWYYFLKYKDYLIVFERIEDFSEPGTIKLIKQDTGECVLKIKNVAGDISVYRDKLYYKGVEGKKLKLNMVNLLNGEHKIYEYVNPESFYHQVIDYTVCGEDIYSTVNVSDTIIKFSEDGISNYHLDSRKPDLYDSLYTDGSRIFMTMNVLDPDKSLVELIATDNLKEIKELGEKSSAETR